MLQCMADNRKRKSWIITNASGSTVFISENQSNVTADGTPLAVGESMDAYLIFGDDPTLALYAQTVVGTADLRIIEGFGEVKGEIEEVTQ